ncbi:MAG: TadE/TadG family type IV pilus assembly protein [Isosphaeraceae bacterium]
MRVRRANGRARRGTAAVEMAAVAPLFFALIIGQIEISRVGMVEQLLTTAARQGCRYAVIQGNSTLTAKAQALSFLRDAGINTLPGNITIGDDPYVPNAVRMQVSVPYGQVSWLGNSTSTFIGTNTMLTGTASMGKESF